MCKNHNLALLTKTCQIYLLYFDHLKGLIPILIFSNEFNKKNEEQIVPIKFHPIIHLYSENEKTFEHINLIYNGKVYFAKRLKIKNVGKIFIILVLTKEFNVYGSDLLNICTNLIKKRFGYSLNEVIASEFLNENLIKSPKLLKIIKKGEIIKEDIRNQLKKVWENYFESIVFSYEKNQLNF